MLNAKTTWQERIEDYAYHCVRLMETFAREEWGYPEDWEIETSVRFTNTRVSKKGKTVRRSSWGGQRRSRKKGKGIVPYVLIQLGCMRAGREGLPYPFNEYNHIKDDPEIGSLPSNNLWERYVAALVAHEVAHAIQHTANTDIPQDANSWLHELKIDKDGHGKYWQSIYRVLRKKFVNDYDALPDLPEEARLPRPKKRQVVTEDIIGKVKIDWGHYRGGLVYGTFDLVKSWQQKKEYYRIWDTTKQKYARQSLIDHGEGKNGFVTIYLPKRNKVIRVTCDRDEVKEMIGVFG